MESGSGGNTMGVEEENMVVDYGYIRRGRERNVIYFGLVK